jgi:FixJ family two-component response regulator
VSDSATVEEVCLVDDDASVLRSIEFLLASDGIKVRAFNKPQEFLAYAATNRVSVLVTDIWMDGVTGLEILARMCAVNPPPRVIVMTAREDLAARATAMQIGPVAYFMKPFDDEKFLGAVRAALASGVNHVILKRISTEHPK